MLMEVQALGVVLRMVLARRIRGEIVHHQSKGAGATTPTPEWAGGPTPTPLDRHRGRTKAWSDYHDRAGSPSFGRTLSQSVFVTHVGRLTRPCSRRTLGGSGTKKGVWGGRKALREA